MTTSGFSTPLDIAWLHSHLLHFHSGGTQFVCNFADRLQADHGDRVRLVVDVAGLEARRFCAERGIPLLELGRSSTNSPWHWLGLRAVVRRNGMRVRDLVRDADVVVSSMFPMNVVARGAGRPHVQVCFEPFAFFHDEACLAALSPAQRAFFRVMGRLHGRADREAVGAADRVVTVNESNVPRFERVYGRTPRVVYLGYDEEFWRRRPAEEARAWRRRWGEAGPLLFHSTDLTGIKGSFGLLAVVDRLVRDLPALKLLVTVYVDNPTGLSRFRAEIRRRGLTGTVHLLGRLDRDELPLVYSAVDLVVQPGNQPANGTLREALLCEAAIVGGPASEDVEEEANGVRVDVDLPEASAERIRWLLDNRDRLDLAVAGRSVIETRFPFARSVKSLRAILGEVANRP